MNQNALGFIEVIGMTAAIEAADACLKSANVRFVGYETVRNGQVTIKIEGDVGAVNAAIQAGKQSASRLNRVISTLIIPRPTMQTSSIIECNHQQKSLTAKEEVIEINEQTELKEEKAIEVTVEIQNYSEKELTDQNEEELLQEFETEELLSRAEAEMYIHKETDEILDIEKKMSQKLHEKVKKNSCNLCNDPNCTRVKGQTHSLCLHYK